MEERRTPPATLPGPFSLVPAREEDLAADANAAQAHVLGCALASREGVRSTLVVVPALCSVLFISRESQRAFLTRRHRRWHQS